MAKKYVFSNSPEQVKEAAKRERNNARISTPSPERHELTQKQWCEWGEGLRRLKNNGYANPHKLSLKEMREVIRSTELCSVYRAAYAMRG